MKASDALVVGASGMAAWALAAAKEEDVKTKTLSLLAAGAAAAYMLSKPKASTSPTPTLSGLGATDPGSAHLSPNAVVASQFTAGQPGTYRLVYTVEAVPYSSPKDSLVSRSAWQQSLDSQGMDGTVDRVEILAPTNGRSTGGAFDVFGAGEMVADFHYAVTVTIRSFNAGGSGLSGLGVVQMGAGALIVGLVIVGSLLVFAFTGHNVLLDVVQFLGAVARAAAGAAAGAAVELLVPLLVVGAVALFVLKKSGARISTKSFSI